MKPTVKIEYECPATGELINSICEPVVDINGEVFCAIDCCPICKGEHYITV
jgi:hypothetical protein